MHIYYTVLLVIDMFGWSFVKNNYTYMPINNVNLDPLVKISGIKHFMCPIYTINYYCIYLNNVPNI